MALKMFYRTRINQQIQKSLSLPLLTALINPLGHSGRGFGYWNIWAFFIRVINSWTHLLLFYDEFQNEYVMYWLFSAAFWVRGSWPLLTHFKNKNVENSWCPVWLRCLGNFMTCLLSVFWAVIWHDPMNGAFLRFDKGYIRTRWFPDRILCLEA